MAEFQEDYSYQCPYCGTQISVLIDLTGGRQQKFTTDCETCCRPILIRVVVDETGVSEFEAERESQ